MQRRHHVEIETARIHLPDHPERSPETKVPQDPAFEFGHAIGPAAKQRQLVELRPDRPFQAAHRVAFDEIVQPLKGDQQLLAEHRQPFAKRCRLRRHIVRAAGDHQVAVRLGLPGEREERGHRLEMKDLERTVDLKLLDVLGQVATGQPEMDELPARQLGELLQPRLHVMQRHPLPLQDGPEIDDVLDAFVILDRLGRDRHAEVLLRLHHRDPEIPLQQDAPLGRPDVLDGRATHSVRQAH